MASLGHETDKLNFAYEGLENKMQELEDKVEELERRGRRDKVLIYSEPETDNEGYEDSERRFIEVVNEVLSNHLTQADIVRAHRIGQKTGLKTRPLVGKLARTTKKTAILKARADFRAKGRGVSGDLTPTQRDMVKQARNDDKIGFFKVGKFHTRLRPHPSPAQTRPTTLSQSSQKPPTPR